MIPNIQAPVEYFSKYSDQADNAKKESSRNKRSRPETGTGALPDRDGSPGTANKPQIVAATIGNPAANRIPSKPSPRLQPNNANATRPVISRRNLTARFTELTFN